MTNTRANKYVQSTESNAKMALKADVSDNLIGACFRFEAGDIDATSGKQGYYIYSEGMKGYVNDLTGLTADKTKKTQWYILEFTSDAGSKWTFSQADDVITAGRQSYVNRYNYWNAKANATALLCPNPTKMAVVKTYVDATVPTALADKSTLLANLCSSLAASNAVKFSPYFYGGTTNHVALGSGGEYSYINFASWNGDTRIVGWKTHNNGAADGGCQLLIEAVTDDMLTAAAEAEKTLALQESAEKDCLPALKEMLGVTEKVANTGVESLNDYISGYLPFATGSLSGTTVDMAKSGDVLRK